MTLFILPSLGKVEFYVILWLNIDHVLFFGGKQLFSKSFCHLCSEFQLLFLTLGVKTVFLFCFALHFNFLLPMVNLNLYECIFCKILFIQFLAFWV
jgi:hypothetical protein